MSLFQKSVLNKYLTELDKDQIEKQYNLYKTYFLNTTIQKNIIASKEEEFQEGFLRELFVKVLGYTINPEPDFNLRTELKNEKDSKKADGAIINKDSVLAVIELKSTTTTDLNKIEIQAFNYKNNQKDCRYIITSNFQKIRFYIDNAIDYMEWDLFKLDLENFKLLYLCLAKENIFSNAPATIKKESLTVEENITKQLYKEYSSFRKSLFNSIVELNPSIDKLLLFKKTQKLLDRFLFLFFSEDRMLVPPNSVRLILDQWNSLKDMDAYQSLYSRFKLYFGYLNTGHKGKLHEIFAYNGGLFAPDEILDIINIDDAILYEATLSLSRYDYNSDVDVNILGHIFEHSLTEIEELENEIANGDKEVAKTTKRKKDGVFYTPKYITKYIVENTVGTLCKSKKEELKIIEEDYHSLTKKERKKLFENLQHYKEWLLHITIVDPACGSGAFLNQALEFLIAEHKFISELEANITGSSIVFDVENSILEKNLFGVDINEESIEIAKLSLWLRTARKGRKLNSLNNNIKCGNSLIDDIDVAGDKAFNWQNEFPKIFEKGGFDVVIGNPPYVRHELIKDIKNTLELMYKCFNSTSDLYTYFYERGLEILNNNGLLSFITPNKFVNSNYGENLRQYLIQYTIYEIIDFGELPVFEDASTFPAIITIGKTYKKVELAYSKLKSINAGDIYNEIEENKIKISISTSEWKFFNAVELKLFNKIKNDSITLKEYVGGEIKFGIKTGYNEAYIIGKELKEKLVQQDIRLSEIIVPFLDGENVRKYSVNYADKYIILAKSGLDLKMYPALIEHFINYKNNLEKRSDKGNEWYQLRTCSYYEDFTKPKILYPDIALESRFTIDENGYFPNATLFIIPKSDKYLLSLLNSKLAWFYFQRNCPVIGDINNRGRLRLKTVYVSSFPVKKGDDILKTTLSSIVDKILSKTNELQQANNQFQKLLSSKFENININNKLEKWYTLSFSEFNKELDKQKIKLSLSQQSEWLQYFEEQKQKALSIKNEIDTTDKLIDKMVYELYGLTEDEIKIVEGN